MRLADIVANVASHMRKYFELRVIRLAHGPGEIDRSCEAGIGRRLVVGAARRRQSRGHQYIAEQARSCIHVWVGVPTQLIASLRKAGQPLVRVYNAEEARDGWTSRHTVVESTVEDMPFLVDSLGMAFTRAELAVHLIVHPVLQVRRDRAGKLQDIGTNGAQAAHPESWQLYEVDRLTDV